MKRFLLSLALVDVLMGASIKFIDAKQDPARVTVNQNQIYSYHDSIVTAKKSVVNIATTKQNRITNEFDNFFNDPFFKEFFGFNFNFGSPPAGAAPG